MDTIATRFVLLTFMIRGFAFRLASFVFRISSRSPKSGSWTLKATFSHTIYISARDPPAEQLVEP